MLDEGRTPKFEHWLLIVSANVWWYYIASTTYISAPISNCLSLRLSSQHSTESEMLWISKSVVVFPSFYSIRVSAPETLLPRDWINMCHNIRLLNIDTYKLKHVLLNNNISVKFWSCLSFLECTRRSQLLLQNRQFFPSPTNCPNGLHYTTRSTCKNSTKLSSHQETLWEIMRAVIAKNDLLRKLRESWDRVTHSDVFCRGRTMYVQVDAIKALIVILMTDNAVRRLRGVKVEKNTKVAKRG